MRGLIAVKTLCNVYAIFESGLMFSRLSPYRSRERVAPLPVRQYSLIYHKVSAKTYTIY
jgi:hypothetical protein